MNWSERGGWRGRTAVALVGFWLGTSGLLGDGPVANFNLLDQWGRAHELRRQEGRAVVLFFTANGCPVARQSAAKLRAFRDQYDPRGVRVFLVNANAGDDREAIRREAQQLGLAHVPILKDETQGLARHLRVYRTCEAVVIRTTDWTVAYRGAMDDQFVEGAGKPEASAHYLRDALEALLTDGEIAVGRTVPRGCRIHFEALAGREDRPVSYVKEVAPILQAKCVACHSPGNIGSWSMNGHRRVRGMAAMLEEVLLTRRMPPWDADPAVGRFHNDPSLTLAEARTLLLWVEQGAGRGEEDGPDPLEVMPPPLASGWPLGEPDIVLRLPRPEKIPANGVLDYRHVEVRAENETDGWMRAMYVRPGNHRVVHHVIVRLKEGGRKDHYGMDEMLAGWAPGATQAFYPEGSGKYLPARARFDLELHYTPCGSEQTDETEIGIYLGGERPRQRFEAVPVANGNFEIPPGVSNAEVHALHHFNRGATLYSVTPHMHLRGAWSRFELLFPNGRREVICSVPRYDFNWQFTYILDKPRRIPPGTWAMMVGGFDNSAGNPSNPDPSRRVYWGEQSWDEMFIGWFNVAWDPEEIESAGR